MKKKLLIYILIIIIFPLLIFKAYDWKVQHDIEQERFDKLKKKSRCI